MFHLVSYDTSVATPLAFQRHSWHIVDSPKFDTLVKHTHVRTRGSIRRHIRSSVMQRSTNSITYDYAVLCVTRGSLCNFESSSRDTNEALLRNLVQIRKCINTMQMEYGVFREMLCQTLCNI